MVENQAGKSFQQIDVIMLTSKYSKNPLLKRNFTVVAWRGVSQRYQFDCIAEAGKIAGHFVPREV
ncbi:hypothetical protein EXU57_23810 [Segetibacter sp. 3557_3]|uniref:hypothetical protein n=1 Tax=Segetibacter sp. 3557_3 TaxID=2547429 RepID=UPI0010585B34|nr:hypothetical protein [Segetibacter sp. 3557_3]TDH18283.1 hypothetical protein EXU57_23810 [Segetibacter sp. 3557_3]